MSIHHTVIERTTENIEAIVEWLDTYKAVQNIAYYEGDMDKVMELQKQIDGYEEVLNNLYKKQHKAYMELLVEVL